MNWDIQTREYWDIGSDQVVSLAKDPMSRIMRSLILCDGKVHGTYCMEKKPNSSELMFKDRYCAVSIRISLPVGAEKEFEKLSKFRLTKPPVVKANKGGH